MQDIRISRVQLAIAYLILAVFMFYQATFSNIRHGIPFRVFTLIYTTQLLFTPVFSADFEKIISNRWMMISLFFAIITGSFTLYTFPPNRQTLSIDRRNRRTKVSHWH
ncbi:unnamed protein product [Brassica oleracea var. botrytis]|uniref:Uncharacterized protein n=2 Tax=Brassica oleracea TaxID=3712 RepID=A0A0D3D0X0_BRAOL|nr:unnamed protein product [Brassica oleracea]